MNYPAALAWLYATQAFGIKLGLENIERLLRELRLINFPRVLHVAGTNGKGSVCAMADSILRAGEYRCGLFTSPHLVSFRERIRVNGEMISQTDAARGLTRIHEMTASWETPPTFFEIATALALLHFAERDCDALVLETGLGGRLDATNIVPSSASAITPISFDHEKWLGHTLAEIAAEKAGIIKAGVPVVSALQPPEAANVIRARARACAAPLETIDQPWTSTRIGLIGMHQQMNAALAVAAVRALGLELTENVIARGLTEVEWPARFQPWGQRITIDGAHNPAGATMLAETWRHEFGKERASIVLAILSDKNTSQIMTTLAQMARRFILPKIRSSRAEEASQLQVVATSLGIDSVVVDDTQAALVTAKNYPERILLTGSLHFAGEALAVLRGEPDALEECLQ
ncbi:MAG: folylpolyglutamate synthase/dihydrofolate synthase family protein [Verrucomicrobiota bacterium]